MALTAVTKAITELKTHADKLTPPPSIVFYNIHKIQSAAVITAAKGIDTVVGGTDPGTADAALKTFTDATAKYFTNLGNVAKKEPPTIKAKLGILVDTAEKDANDAGKTEIEMFVKSMAGRSRSEEVDPAPMEALKEHFRLRQRGLKEVEDHREVVQKALVTVKANRTKGQTGLEESQKLADTMREEENKVSQGGDFLKGRISLEDKYKKPLNTGAYPKDVVTRLRLADAKLFDDGMRAMAEARDLRTEILKEISAHELEMDKVMTEQPQDEGAQLAQLGRADDAFKRLDTDAIKVANKLDKSQWSKIEGYTASNAENLYKAKVDETLEAFRTLPLMNSTLQTITQRVEVFRFLAASQKVSERINALQSGMSKLRGTFRSAAIGFNDFKTLNTKCDQTWQERENAV